MNKRKGNVELKLYELLGVKKFKKFVFFMRNEVCGIKKENRKYILYRKASNYNLGKVSSLEDVIAFKKQLFLNTVIHIFGLLICLPITIKVFTGSTTLLLTIMNVINNLLNLYCIMLQRYNAIRINQFIERKMPYYEKQKNELKDELKKVDSLIREHTYKILNINKKEYDIEFEEILSKFSIDELKKIRKYLVYYNNKDNKDDKHIIIPIKKQKVLKIELNSRSSRKK